MNDPSKSKTSAKITITLEFTSTGYLKSVLLNAQHDGDEEVLIRALNRLLKPGHFTWVRRLFRRP
jgi:hypothetical protein